MVFDGYVTDGDVRVHKTKVVPVRFTPGCQYSITTKDVRCDGCIHNNHMKETQ